MLVNVQHGKMHGAMIATKKHALKLCMAQQHSQIIVNAVRFGTCCMKACLELTRKDPCNE